MRLIDSREVSGVPRATDDPLVDLLAATGGRLIGPTRISSFAAGAALTRGTVVPGCCFVALRGERVDGHRFVSEALRGGAACRAGRSAQSSLPGTGWRSSRCGDALIALQELAAWWRARSSVRVVGITGSTGKTLAKEIVADVLARSLRVLRNEGNLNRRPACR